MARSRDTLHINELLLTLSISNDDVQDTEANPQPISLSLIIAHDISRTARSDDLTHSINYAVVYTTLVETLPKTRYNSLEALADHVFESLFRSHPEVDEARVVVTVRDNLPRFTIETIRRRDRASTGPSGFTIDELSFPAIIGVNPQERAEKQPVVFDIMIHRQQRFVLQGSFPFLGLSTSIRQVCATVPLQMRQCANGRHRHLLRRNT